MALQPITLFAFHLGPNPPKVAILLNELNIPYKLEFLEFASDGPKGVKHPDYTQYNPNGRVPCIIDPNNDNVVVWESGAILQYLQKRYDKDNKLGASTAQEEADILSYLFFQVSGAGPTQGQVVHFTRWHPEKIPSAIERYTNEIKRIYAVLEKRLKEREKEGSEFFVTDHFTIVDAAFYPWINTKMVEYSQLSLEEFPTLLAWSNRIGQRPAVIKAYESLA